MPGAPDNGWRAQLTLGYGATGGKTVLRQQRHAGPLMVQKPFYPEGPQTCHTYLIHPPGGVVGGDRLGLDVSMAPGSHAVITTPAAGKFYRSAGARASQIQRLNVGADTALEWVPQETIVYPSANAKMRTIVRLAPQAKFIGWEIICLGLPASDHPFRQGQLDQGFDVWRGDRPLLVERLRIRDRDAVTYANWGLAGQPVTGTMVATTEDHDLLAAIREKTGKLTAPGLFSATRLNGLTVCRYLGGDIFAGFRFFVAAWEVIRPVVMGMDAYLPRIWAT